MEQKHLVLVLFALLIASFTTSFHSYRTTEQWVTEDMSQALAQTLAEQQTDIISQDTISVFNSHLQMEALRGKATIAIDTHQQQAFRPKAYCSMATIFALSDQRPAGIMSMVTLLWMLFCLYQRRRSTMEGRLLLVDGQFVTSQGETIRLTPMQQQLMEMFWQAPHHTLTKDEICAALWPKKPDANDTLYALIRRLRSIIETQTQMKIVTDRGRSYSLTDR